MTTLGGCICRRDPLDLFCRIVLNLRCLCPIGRDGRGSDYVAGAHDVHGVGGDALGGAGSEGGRVGGGRRRGAKLVISTAGMKRRRCSHTRSSWESEQARGPLKPTCWAGFQRGIALRSGGELQEPCLGSATRCRGRSAKHNRRRPLRFIQARRKTSLTGLEQSRRGKRLGQGTPPQRRARRVVIVGPSGET